MKKIYLFFSIILVGCTTITIFSDNKNCISIRKFEIFQTLNDGGALAHECTLLDGCSYQNQLVYLHWQPNIDYYDDMIVNVPSSKCAIRDGVYKYISKQDILKTVPIIRFDYKNAPKSKKDILERLKNVRNEVYFTCLHESKLDGKEEPKICNCFTEQFMKYIIDINSQENTEYSKNTIIKMMEECNNSTLN